MRKVTSVAASLVIAICLLASAAVALSQSGIGPGVLRPLVVDVVQDIPLDAQIVVPVQGGDPISVTVPVTMHVAMQVSISGLDVQPVGGSGAASILVSSPITAGGELVDDLGHPYTVAIDSPDVELREWTTYVGDGGRWRLAGEVFQQPETADVDDIIALVRMYDADGELVEVTEILNVAYRLEPGRPTRFETVFSSDPENVARYDVEMRVFSEPAEE